MGKQYTERDYKNKQVELEIEMSNCKYEAAKMRLEE